MITSFADKIEWTSGFAHRDAKIRFKKLLEGDPKSKANFDLSLVETSAGYTTPRHHHNFEQIRYAIEHTSNYGPKRDIPEGAIAYFPEGAYYGPQNYEEDCSALVLQFGGPSGAGFLSRDELFQGGEELRAAGEFKNGTYRGPIHGRHRSLDGYEAVWEHVRGRELSYPKACYPDPVLMYPENFTWRPVTDQPGVLRMMLGVFSDAETALYKLRIDQDHSARLAADAEHLVWVESGTVRCEDELLGERSAAHLLRTDDQVLTADSGEARVLVIGLPKLI